MLEQVFRFVWGFFCGGRGGGLYMQYYISWLLKRGHWSNLSFSIWVHTFFNLQIFQLVDALSVKTYQPTRAGVVNQLCSLSFVTHFSCFTPQCWGRSNIPSICGSCTHVDKIVSTLLLCLFLSYCWKQSNVTCQYDIICDKHLPSRAAR